VGLGSPTNSQPGRLRYVAQASGLRVLAASSRQFWWLCQDAPRRASAQRDGSVHQLMAVNAGQQFGATPDVADPLAQQCTHGSLSGRITLTLIMTGIGMGEIFRGRSL